MKVLEYEKYNSIENFKLIDVSTPKPKENEILIKVKASSINSYDYRIMKGKPFLVRLQKGLFKPKKPYLGCDVAGSVEKVGSNVTKFKVGDNVFGCLADGNGDNAYSEYVCAKENIIAPIPNNVSFNEAATIPMAGLTALQALRDFGKIKKDQKVLINGSTGGVGMFAIQIAKESGAIVTGVCKAESMNKVIEIGADYVIDTKEDFLNKGIKYDLIIDVVANHSFSEYKKILNENGICVMVGFSKMGHMLKVLINSAFSKNKKQKIVLAMAKNSIVTDLNLMAELVSLDKIKPVIDKEFEFTKIKEAFEYYEKEHIKGKIIIKMID